MGVRLQHSQVVRMESDSVYGILQINRKTQAKILVAVGAQPEKLIDYWKHATHLRGKAYKSPSFTYQLVEFSIDAILMNSAICSEVECLKKGKHRWSPDMYNCINQFNVSVRAVGTMLPEKAAEQDHEYWENEQHYRRASQGLEDAASKITGMDLKKLGKAAKRNVKQYMEKK